MSFLKLKWFSSGRESENQTIISNIGSFSGILGGLLNEYKTVSLKNVDHLKNIASLEVIEDLSKKLKTLDSNRYVLENLLAIRKKGLEKYILELEK
jgi:hypothetical protein